MSTAYAGHLHLFYDFFTLLYQEMHSFYNKRSLHGWGSPIIVGSWSMLLHKVQKTPYNATTYEITYVETITLKHVKQNIFHKVTPTVY